MVPPKYHDRSAIIEVDRLSSAPLVGATTPGQRARHSRVDVQDVGPATTGKPRLEATTRRLTSVRSQTAEVDARRPNPLGLVAARVGRLGICPEDRQGRDRRRLASQKQWGGRQKSKAGRLLNERTYDAQPPIRRRPISGRSERLAFASGFRSYIEEWSRGLVKSSARVGADGGLGSVDDFVAAESLKSPQRPTGANKVPATA